jgi:hypothetical protein
MTRNTLEIEQVKSAINKSQDETVQDSRISILCLNITQSKYYVYATNGILQNRVNYHDISLKYGEPVSTSSNGQYFVFKRRLDDIMQRNDLTLEQMIEESMTVHIFKLSIFRL